MKKFHITDILSILNQNVASTRGIEGTIDILNYMKTDNLNPFQVRYVSFKCKPSLLLQFDFLKDAMLLDNARNIQQDWIDKTVIEYGEYFEVKPLHSNIVSKFKKTMNKLDEMVCKTTGHSVTNRELSCSRCNKLLT
jgi:hypothetical protein